MKKLAIFLILTFVLLSQVCSAGPVIWLGSAGYPTLAKAVTYIGSAKETLFVPAGLFHVDSDLTIPANIALEVLEGANILIAPGVTLKICGPFSAGEYQVFTDDSADLTKGVKFMRSCPLVSVSPEWWGAVGNGSVDSATAINQAINSADPTPDGVVYHRIPVQFGPGKYWCAGTINLIAYTTLRGFSGGNNTTVLVTSDNVRWSLIAGNKAHGVCLENLTLTSGYGCSGNLVHLFGHGNLGVIRGCHFNTASYPANGSSWALFIDLHYRIQVHHNAFTGSGGVYFDGCDSWFFNNRMEGPGKNPSGSTGLFSVVGAIIDSNEICGWYQGIFMGWSVVCANMIYNNTIAQCTYAIRNSDFGPAVGPWVKTSGSLGGSGGLITGNYLTNSVYGYTSDSWLSTRPRTHKVILMDNQFINIAGSGPEKSIPTAGVLENDGQHIITKNTFLKTVTPFAGSGASLVYENLGIDLPINYSHCKKFLPFSQINYSHCKKFLPFPLPPLEPLEGGEGQGEGG